MWQKHCSNICEVHVQIGLKHVLNSLNAKVASFRNQSIYLLCKINWKKTELTEKFGMQGIENKADCVYHLQEIMPSLFDFC